MGPELFGDTFIYTYIYLASTVLNVQLEQESPLVGSCKRLPPAA